MFIRLLAGYKSHVRGCTPNDLAVTSSGKDSGDNGIGFVFVSLPKSFIRIVHRPMQPRAKIAQLQKAFLNRGAKNPAVLLCDKAA